MTPFPPLEPEVPSDFAPYLRPTAFLESDHPDVIAFARRAVEGVTTARERAVRLFFAVRDGIPYDAYTFRVAPEVLRASVTVRAERSFCVSKAILLCAAARAVGIPSRIGLADVRNHLATKRLIEVMGTDLFVCHGFSELWLGQRWVKATPTFDRSLCEKFGVPPLDFDGERDALFHAYDTGGRRHMEYVRQRGSFADLPYDAFVEAIREAYPHIADFLATPWSAPTPPGRDLPQPGDLAKEAKPIES
jgi:transglutaminase-like putative cysteine protease